MIDEKKQTPEAKAIQARMAKANVSSQSQLHELYGKTVVFSDYTEGTVTTPGGPGTIDYAVGDRFRATMANGRQPWGSIANLVPAGDGTFTYDLQEGA